MPINNELINSGSINAVKNTDIPKIDDSMSYEEYNLIAADIVAIKEIEAIKNHIKNSESVDLDTYNKEYEKKELGITYKSPKPVKHAALDPRILSPVIAHEIGDREITYEDWQKESYLTDQIREKYRIIRSLDNKKQITMTIENDLGFKEYISGNLTIQAYQKIYKDIHDDLFIQTIQLKEQRVENRKH